MEVIQVAITQGTQQVRYALKLSKQQAPGNHLQPKYEFSPVTITHVHDAVLDGVAGGLQGRV